MNGGDEALVRKDAEICYLRHGEADDDETFGVHGEVEAVLVPDGVVGGGNRKFDF